MPPVKGKMWSYSQEALRAAVADVSSGVPVSTAAKRHGVPRVTLLYKVRGKTPLVRKMGPSSILSFKEEEILVHWIKLMCQKGFPVTSDQLLDSVQHLVKKLSRENPFADDRPGRKWLMLFRKRHPDISSRVAENLTMSRASVTKAFITSWYQEVEKYSKEKSLFEVLSDPSRVFNGDESAFFLNPKGNKVLAPKGSKSVYLNVNTDEKECLTVLVTASASGMLAPPMVVFKYARVPKYISDSVPSFWGIGISDNGWMTRITFYEYITNVFYPWLVKNEVTLPIILFVDGHTSHLSLHLSQFCEEKGIVLVALPANTTHFMQPMDVAVFRSLKETWQSKTHEWRVKMVSTMNSLKPVLKKEHFCPLLKEVLEEKVTKTIVNNGFRKCGLCPWNIAEPLAYFDRPGNNPETLLLSSESSSLKDSTQSEDLPILKRTQIALSVLENYIGPEKVSSFEGQSVTWTGSIADKSLYEIWATMKNDLNQTVDNNKDEENNGDVSEVQIIHVQAEIHAERPAVVEVIQEQPPVIAQQNPNLLPSPFKNCLIWPQEPQNDTKKRRRESIPSVVSSDAYRQYCQKIADKKTYEEERKKQRAEERAAKKRAVEDGKKKKEEEKLKKMEGRKKKAGSQKKKNGSNGVNTRAGKRKKPISSSSEEDEWVPSSVSSSDCELAENQDTVVQEEIVDQQEIMENSRNEPEDNFVNENGHVEFQSSGKDLGMQNIALEECENPVNTIEDADDIIRSIEAALEESDLNIAEDVATVEDVEVEKTALDEPDLDLNTEEDIAVIENIAPVEDLATVEDFCLTENDFAIISLSGKKRVTKAACKVLEIDNNGQACVMLLAVCNRLKTVFEFEQTKKLIVGRKDVVTKLPVPLIFGLKKKDPVSLQFEC